MKSRLSGFGLVADIDAELSRWLAALTVRPSNDRIKLLDALVGGLKRDGDWPYLDNLYLFASHDAQAATVNLKMPSDVGTVTNLAFIADRGLQSSIVSIGGSFEGRAVTSAGSSWSRNDAHLAVWLASRGATSQFRYLAFGGNGVGALSIGNLTTMGVNGAANGTALYVTGYMVATRGNADDFQVEVDSGVLNYAAASTDATGSIRFGNPLGNNPGATGDLLSIATTGRHLDAPRRARMKARFLTYLTAIGAA